MNPSPSGSDPRVVRFPSGRHHLPPPAERDELASYASTPEPAAEYRQRMLVNGVVFVIVVALIGAALWLADSMASMRRNQDCVLSGRVGCTPVEAPPAHRW